MRLVPQWLQKVRERLGEEWNQRRVDPDIGAGVSALRTVIAGSQESSFSLNEEDEGEGVLIASSFGFSGSLGGAGRRHTVIICAGTQIQLGRIEPVAERQSLQWSVAIMGR